MNTVVPATSRQETPVWFDAGEHLLFGILTRPRDQVRGVAVIIVPGAGTPLSTNVNDLSVRLCRSVSAHGFHGFRFDYHGVGESTGTLDRFHLAEPFVLDLQGGHPVPAGSRASSGSCSSGRASERGRLSRPRRDTEGLVALILICPPVRDFEMGEAMVARGWPQS